MTPGELLLEAGYRQCLFCGRLMLRDGVPVRRMAEEESSTFKPCVALGDVCVECAGLTAPRTDA